MSRRDQDPLFEALHASVNGDKLGDLALQPGFPKASKVCQLQGVIRFEAGRIDR